MNWRVLLERHQQLFLAAYAAVNAVTLIMSLPPVFLAAYAAVNAMATKRYVSGHFLAAWLFVELCKNPGKIDDLFNPAKSGHPLWNSKNIMDSF